MLTEAEQNRLVLENTKLCTKICADYRSANVDFEDLLAEAQLALVAAARQFNPLLAKFSVFASLCINQALVHLLNREKKHRRVDDVEIEGVDGFGIIQPEASDGPTRVLEWTAWGVRGNAKAICDWYVQVDPFGNPIPGLPVKPDDIKRTFEIIANRADRFPSAIIGLTPFERKLIRSYLDGVEYADMARLYRLSYRATLIWVDQILRMMREVIAGQDRAARKEAREAKRRMAAAA